MRGAALTAGRKLTMRVVARSADDDLGHFGGLVGSLRAGGGRILTTAFAIGHYRQTLDPGVNMVNIVGRRTAQIDR